MAFVPKNFPYFKTGSNRMDEKSIDGSEVRFCGMMYSSEHRKETCKYVNKKGI